MIRTALLFALALASPARAGVCEDAGRAASQAAGLPDGLLAAIGQVETGRRDSSGALSAWPWSVNANGASHYFASAQDAVAHVQALRSAGVTSIDTGCFQMNLLYHPDAFASLDDAFDPASNAAAAAAFLARLHAETGSWAEAAARYHSANPGRGQAYAAQVLARWHDGPALAAPAVIPAAGPPGVIAGVRVVTPGMRYAAMAGLPAVIVPGLRY